MKRRLKAFNHRLDVAQAYFIAVATGVVTVTTYLLILQAELKAAALQLTVLPIFYIILWAEAKYTENEAIELANLLATTFLTIALFTLLAITGHLSVE